MKTHPNRYIEKVASVLGEHDPLRAVRLLVQPYRQERDTLESIATSLGVSEIVEERLPLEGLISKSGRRLTITINSLSPRVRQRFTLAHEIGHLLLAGLVEGKKDCSKDMELERACDAIAAELLMPGEETISFIRQLRSFSPESLRALARKFEVSLHTAAVRVHRDLRLWPQSIGLWEFRESPQQSERSNPGGFDERPQEVWFVGKRRWKTRRPPFAAFYRALSSSAPIRTRESYFEDNEMKPVSLEVLNVGHNRLLGMVA